MFKAGLNHFKREPICNLYSVDRLSYVHVHVHKYIYKLRIVYVYIPYVHLPDLMHSLETFVNQKTKEFNNKIKKNLFANLEDTGKKERLAKLWINSFNEVQSSGVLDINYDSSWSEIYHKLIHSPALEALLQLEYSYSMAMKDMVTKRDKTLLELQEKQVFCCV